MNIYLIELKDDLIDWDCVIGAVIAAESEDEARLMISKNAGDEGAQAWLEPESSTIELVAQDLDIEKRIILDSFNAG